MPGNDFQTTSGQMDFSPQENKKQLGISPLADNVPEMTEQFLLVLTRVEGELMKPVISILFSLGCQALHI